MSNNNFYGLLSADGPGGIFEDLNRWSRGENVPSGSLYNSESLSAARAALLTNLGGTLLAASQRGVSPDARAQMLAQIGNGPAAHQQTLRAGAQEAAQRAQIEQARAQTLLAQQRAARQLAHQNFWAGDGAGAQTPVMPPQMMPPQMMPPQQPQSQMMPPQQPQSQMMPPQMMPPQMPATQFEDDANFQSQYQSRPVGTTTAPAAPSAAPAAPSAAPAGGGGVRAVNADVAQQRDAILSDVSLTPDQQSVALANLSAEHAARNGTPSIAGGYRANPGLNNAFVGSADPTGVVNGAQPGAGSARAQAPAPAQPQAPAPAPAQPQAQVPAQPQARDIRSTLSPAQRMMISNLDADDANKILLNQSFRAETTDIIPPDVARQLLGAGFDANTTYQRNSRTGAITQLAARETFTTIPTEAATQRFGGAIGPNDVVQQSSNGRVYVERAGERTELLSPEDAAARLGQNYDPRRTYQVSSTRGVVPVDPLPPSGTNVALSEIAQRRITRMRDASDAQTSTLLPRLDGVTIALRSGAFETGKLQEALLPLNQWLASANILTPEAANRTSATEAFRATIRAIQPNMRVEGSGASTDRDMVLFEQAIPSLSNTRSGNILIASTLSHVLRREQTRIALAEEWFATNGNLRGFDAHAERELGPTFQRVTVQDGNRTREAANADEFQSAIALLRPGTVVRLPDTPETRRISGYPFFVVQD